MPCLPLSFPNAFITCLSQPPITHPTVPRVSLTSHPTYLRPRPAASWMRSQYLIAILLLVPLPCMLLTPSPLSRWDAARSGPSSVQHHRMSRPPCHLAWLLDLTPPLPSRQPPPTRVLRGSAWRPCTQATLSRHRTVWPPCGPCVPSLLPAMPPSHNSSSCHASRICLQFFFGHLKGH